MSPGEMVKNRALPKASVIISVYNQIEFLKSVLAGFEIQTFKNFEIIVSDDGSGEEFVSELNKIMNLTSMQIKHCWHPDEGFRKNMILNKSIQLAASDYLIFIDGDCIPHPNFIEEHLKYAAIKVCLCGRRVNLSDRITQKLTLEKIKNGQLQSFKASIDMLYDFFRLKLFHVMNGFYIKNSLLRKYFNRKERGLLGSNFSLYKFDIMAINGFDERYTKPSFGEDSDIEFRLRLNGVKIKPVLNIAVQYHLYHRILPRPYENKVLYELVIKEKRVFTPYGIKK
jgi:glycosyltransferase involved in cell wall biosynthesis